MKLNLYPVLLLVLTISFTPSLFAQAQPCQPSVFDTNRGATLFLHVVMSDSKTGALTAEDGTGFVISSDGFVLTNKHLIEMDKSKDQRQVQARISSRYSSTPYELKVVDEDTSSDIALLKILDTSHKYQAVLIGDPKVQTGTPLCSGGFPGIEDYHATDGRLSGNLGERWTTNMITHKGESGSPVFLGSGEVVALRVEGFVDGPDRNILIPISLATGLLGKVADLKSPCYLVTVPSNPPMPPVSVSLSLDGGPVVALHGDDPQPFACDNRQHSFEFTLEWDLSRVGSPNRIDKCKTQLQTTPWARYQLIGILHQDNPPYSPVYLTGCKLTTDLTPNGPRM